MTRSSIVGEALLVLALSLTTMTISAIGRAQGGDAPLADALFDEGRKLMKEGDYAQACPKLAESFRLDPAGGSLLNLALCHEKQGKTASAWAEFKDALAMAVKEQRPDREAFAREHIEALEPLLSRLTIELAPGADLPGLAVARDGSEVGSAAFGMPLPIDPGNYEITATATGHRSWSTKITVGGEGDNQTVAIPVLDATPEGAADPDEGDPIADQQPDDGSSQRLLGFVAGGVGIAATIVGAGFGLRTFSLHSESNDKCGDDGLCPDTEEGREGLAANEDAHTSATLANVFVGAGLALVAVGVVVVLTAPSAETSEPATSAFVSPSVSPDAAGLRFELLW